MGLAQNADSQTVISIMYSFVHLKDGLKKGNLG